MDHVYAMLMLYAAVNGPATFNERFGSWEQAAKKPSITVAHNLPSKPRIVRRITVAKPINIVPCTGCNVIITGR